MGKGEVMADDTGNKKNIGSNLMIKSTQTVPFIQERVSVAVEELQFPCHSTQFVLLHVV